MKKEEKKKEEVAEEIPEEEAPTAREACYREILKVPLHGMARYYQEFPERIKDKRADDALEWSTRGITRIIGILDGYEINFREEKEGEEKPKEEE